MTLSEKEYCAICGEHCNYLHDRVFLKEDVKQFIKDLKKELDSLQIVT